MQYSEASLAGNFV